MSISQSRLCSRVPERSHYWLVSSLFSGNIGLSLVGKLYDTDTFVLILTSFCLYFGINDFQSENERLFLLNAILFSRCRFLVSIFSYRLRYQHYSIQYLPHKLRLIGGWNDFSIFFGLMGVLSLVF